MHPGEQQHKPLKISMEPQAMECQAAEPNIAEAPGGHTQRQVASFNFKSPQTTRLVVKRDFYLEFSAAYRKQLGPAADRQREKPRRASRLGSLAAHGAPPGQPQADLSPTPGARRGVFTSRRRGQSAAPSEVFKSAAGRLCAASRRLLLVLRRDSRHGPGRMLTDPWRPEGWLPGPIGPLNW